MLTLCLVFFSCLQGQYKFKRQCYGSYDHFNKESAPPLLTHAIYLQRAARFEHLRVAGKSKTKAQADSNIRNQCKQVAGRSALCRLEYFDMVEHTLLDMMHLVQGVVGSHLVPLVKGSRLTEAITTLLKEKHKKRIEDEDPPVAPPRPHAPPRVQPMAAPLPRSFQMWAQDIAQLINQKADGTLRRALRPEEAKAIEMHNAVPAEVQAKRIEQNFQYTITLNPRAEPAAAAASSSSSSPAAVAAAAASSSSSVAAAASSSAPPATPKRQRESTMVGGAAAAAASSSPAAASSPKRARQVEPAAPAAAAAAASSSSSAAAAAAAVAVEPVIPPWKWPQNRDLHRLRQHQQRFPTLTAAALERLELAYRRIHAPLHIAPASKMPFQKSGEMTAHHWLNFAKCHGPVLLRAHFHSREDERTMVTLRSMLDLLSLCLRSNVTAEVKVETARVQAMVAAHFEEDWPETEHAIVMHLLIFHMAATIRKWGPARGYWCFPFERMIGKLSSSIKNRRYPEINLIYRYMLNLATHKTHAAADAEAAAADEEYQLSHPLVITAQAVNSQLRADQVFWPAATKNNRRRAPQDGKLSHARQRILIPILGLDECQLYAGVKTDFIMWNYRISLQVGRWKYNTEQKENRDHGQVGKSRTSWFRIRAKNVPNWNAEELQKHVAWTREHVQTQVDIMERPRDNMIRPPFVDPWDGDSFVYGRIIHFSLLELTDPRWAKSYQLAEVKLYYSFQIDGTTQLPLLSFDVDQLHFHDSLGVRRPIEHIQAKHLDALIGIAPMGKGTQAHPEHELWYVLPVDPC
jgi:chemotaxis protein histidine kinase CheA